MLYMCDIIKMHGILQCDSSHVIFSYKLNEICSIVVARWSNQNIIRPL